MKLLACRIRPTASHRLTFALLLGLLSLGLRAQTGQPPVVLPRTVVEGQNPPLAEESSLGAYQQPAWTAHRRFSTTRVFVQKDPWEIGLEQWWRGRFYRDGSAKHLFQEELEVGLPHRGQLDLYENWVMDDKRRIRHHDVALEGRWALADWGKIPLNPTLYGEWKFVDQSQGPDVFELKLLLGEQLAPRWHWGLNAVFEQEVGGQRATEWAWSQAISYTFIDECLSGGLEMKFTHETVKGGRNQPEIGFLVGPSLQWRPFKGAHLDVVPLFGATHDAPRVEAYLIFGFDFWPGERTGEGRLAPASTRGN